LVIEFYKVYDMEKDIQSVVMSTECTDYESYENVVSKPWEIEGWAFETKPNHYKAFCYVDMDGIDSFSKVEALVERELDRKTLAYVAERKAVYTSVFQRMEAMIYGEQRTETTGYQTAV